ncbi:GNAT family N-acetyltransferase [Flavivirga jejuensis]|uniref:GNAT family N-acetyltransferase n=1 Tax=Flavivirga jejuensis TaxID=870487 RepID=A0ABT8WIS6_9FLAO|nr:GNAT family N-acetyltransferase [Flavivirga jejuensis]MDO5973042.1 GNAT family N-acetyltransferase [Flavivirga jejuensis]
MNTIIETERLILREFTMNDFEAVYEFNSNTELHKYTGDEIIKSLDHAKEIIKDIWIQDYKKYGYGRWATIYKPENKIIGFAGLKYLPEINETDIGFRFLPEYWGKGIASEITEEIIRFGFENLRLDKIIGIAMPENVGSWKVLEKNGLTLYKVGEYDGDGKDYKWYKIKK